ncbi:MAG: hypothetical protein M3M94_01095 [Actinomycetota bacterium]|nr:hypothetical protein [Actinomycetota bacterium]
MLIQGDIHGFTTETPKPAPVMLPCLRFSNASRQLDYVAAFARGCMR